MAILAGCAGPGEEEDPGVDDQDEVAPDEEPEADEDDEPEADDEDTEDEEAEDDDEEEEAEDDGEETDDEVDADGTGDAEDWEDVEEVFLDGEEDGWIGRRPEFIEGEENPTLELYEGREYEIGWENLDGEDHNLALYDGDGGSIDSTSIHGDEFEGDSLTIDASDELAEYICEVHPDEMVGEIEIHEG